MLSLLSYIWNHSRRHEIVLNYLQELKHPAENSRYGLCNSLQIPEDSVIVTLTKPTNKQQEWRQCWILKLVRSITPIQAELALCMKENLIAWTHSVETVSNWYPGLYMDRWYRYPEETYYVFPDDRDDQENVKIRL
ncbi:uncharacterized protein OCT59_030073 [Rhizophagus irregularis]|uniref:uncharacterized protein n=1 Tax=Rhizophagus irregularis TaxID=588596 RepID=UPI001DFC6FDF|nr:hypothetical protein OCT59_030073 [Rhizophagus irregularis]CAG8547610.1 12832_t:CDS:2 [Rhizophagus irregularis]